ncbi:MAG TPA: hemerythrin family protein [Planctomycetota bacterium]|jgi:hemerythrin
MAESRKPLWDEKYRIGVPEVDAQHQRWFELVDAVLQLVESGEADALAVNAAMLEAIDYAEEHFKEEEALMRRVNLPLDELESHCSMHHAFRTRINALMRHCRDEYPNVAAEMVAFMHGWLVHHILETDIKFLGFYKQNGSWSPSHTSARTSRGAAN